MMRTVRYGTGGFSGSSGTPGRNLKATARSCKVNVSMNSRAVGRKLQ
ncbi:hypothetical protein Enr13x_30870 [Stieleria neptunia]|uniref:Uncharacterized protein n=1 Tax=Stieleria neptunia TaxID=2527979 RepID=A0A518HQV5_9BACT|nr:hypothetical protein Enr13x_30870 [Stieleria neptunia]